MGVRNLVGMGEDPMIAFEHVTYAYPRQDKPVLQDLSLSIDEGEFVLVVGPSGAGKSTFLRCLNGLVPHFYGGHFSGHLRVAGRDPVAAEPRGMADRVGFVFQDPEAQFVVDTVEDELVFAMENFALAQPVMRKRVEEVLDQLGIAHLRSRRISTLSGGEKQRVALAAVLTLHPQVLVLDEPTSQLDPQAAEEVLVALRQLNEDLGLTVVLSEHRLERVVQYADRIVYFPAAGAPVITGAPEEVLSAIPLVPPLVALGKALDWHPLPLTIKEARRFARQMPLAGSRTVDVTPAPPPAPGKTQMPARAARTHEAALAVDNVWYDYASREALRGVSLSIKPGEIVALMGRNGAGKTTLMKLMVGLLRAKHGQVMLASDETPHSSANGHSQRNGNGKHSGSASPAPAAAVRGLVDTSRLSLDDIVKVVGYVPQDPGLLLFQDTIDQELAFTRKGHQMAPSREADDRLLARLGIEHLRQRYPRDLSGGERQRAALAAMLVADPRVLLLDEPTRGLDYQQKQELNRLLQEFKSAGKSILLATHDVELVATCADRVIMLAEGQVVLDAPTRVAMSESLVFASQINKLLRDPAYLTVDDVLHAVVRTN